MKLIRWLGTMPTIENPKGFKWKDHETTFSFCRVNSNVQWIKCIFVFKVTLLATLRNSHAFLRC